MGSGAGQGGMAGAVPPGGIASMMGQMSPGMGGPMPQQGMFANMFGGPQGAFSQMGGQPAMGQMGGAPTQSAFSQMGGQSALNQMGRAPTQGAFSQMGGQQALGMFGGPSAPDQMDAQRQLAMFGGQPGMRVGQTGMLPPQAQGQGQGLQGLMTQFRQAQPGTSMPTTQSQMASRMAQPPQALSQFNRLFGRGGV